MLSTRIVRLRPAVATLIALCALTDPVPVSAALSASIADATLPPVAYAHEARSSNGTLELTATDTGTLLGGNSGWNVTVQSSNLMYSGPHSGAPIPAANFAIITAHPPRRVSGQAISAEGGPRVPAGNSTGTLDVPRKTLQADGPGGLLGPYYGIGTYAQSLDVRLAIPGQARAGTYRATLTVTISAGP